MIRTHTRAQPGPGRPAAAFIEAGRSVGYVLLARRDTSASPVEPQRMSIYTRHGRHPGSREDDGRGPPRPA